MDIIDKEEKDRSAAAAAVKTQLASGNSGMLNADINYK